MSILRSAGCVLLTTRRPFKPLDGWLLDRISRERDTLISDLGLEQAEGLRRDCLRYRLSLKSSSRMRMHDIKEGIRIE